jgi:hypothetical protein
MAFEEQSPWTTFARLGLQGALGQDPVTGQRISTESLSPLAQAGLANYFNQQLEPGYALSLAQAAMAEPGAAPTDGLRTQEGQPYPSFEQFALGQLQGGRTISPEQFGSMQTDLISALQDTGNVTDPYRQALMGYLEGGGDITGTGAAENTRLLRALNAPTLSRISPIYRKAAADRMAIALKNRMVQQPERQFMSFYTGNRFDTIDPTNFESFAPVA